MRGKNVWEQLSLFHLSVWRPRRRESLEARVNYLMENFGLEIRCVFLSASISVPNRSADKRAKNHQDYEKRHKIQCTLSRSRQSNSRFSHRKCVTCAAVSIVHPLLHSYNWSVYSVLASVMPSYMSRNIALPLYELSLKTLSTLYKPPSPNLLLCPLRNKAIEPIQLKQKQKRKGFTVSIRVTDDDGHQSVKNIAYQL